jgi:hypothetical protein
MTDHVPFWSRLRRFSRPDRETYETWQQRPSAQDPAAPGTEHYPPTDYRRSGGSGAIGP